MYQAGGKSEHIVWGSDANGFQHGWEVLLLVSPVIDLVVVKLSPSDAFGVSLVVLSWLELHMLLCVSHLALNVVLY